MARATTRTKLPLDTFARILGINPLHFNQIRLSNGNDPFCDRIIFQEEWQTADAVSREEIARVIADAEAKIEQALGFHLAPTWDVDEWRSTAQPHDKTLFNLNGAEIRGLRQTVFADWGYFISGGIEAKELIEAGAAIVWSDRNGDGFFETGTVQVVTSVVDPAEIAAFYPGEDGDDSWEIRPIDVTIAAGTATITFKREQVVAPEFFDILDANAEDTSAVYSEDEDFLEEIDVYRRYNDPQSQVSMLWEPWASGCSGCGGDGCTACAYTIQTGCLILRGDPRNSQVGFAPAEWDSDTLEFSIQPFATSRMPDIARLYYYSGWRNKRNRYLNRMDPDWERVVAYMAASMLERPFCDCSNDTWSKWRQDFLLRSGDEDGKPFYNTPTGILNNPFGSRRGELEAWRKVRVLIRGRSVQI